MAGVDNQTGKTLEGFEHVEQSLSVIFSTPQGARVMREWFGNPGLKVLGRRNVTPKTILLWAMTMWMLCELFEPRYKLTRILLVDAERQGWPEFLIEGQHRPYAHLEWQQAAMFVSINDEAVTVRSAT